jgi:hypothetical protein
MFATTEHLILRAYVDSDGERIRGMYNNQQVQRAAMPDYIVPWGPPLLSKWLERLNSALMHVIIEVKEDQCGFLSWAYAANN